MDDAGAIAAIYNHYILHSVITFEEEVIDAAEMVKRMTEVQEKFPWFVWEAGGEILGYAYANTWKSRCAYRNSAEVTVYLRHDAGARGIGFALYSELLARLEAMGMHAVMGGIALPNAASVALHEKCGFQKVAEFIEVGYKFGQWINVGYWQRNFPHNKVE
jgi:L-amino acid N-acyltransferase YncA